MQGRTALAKAFISYARSDGEVFATALRRRLEEQEPEITLWQDRTQMEGGVGWWKQITDALDSVQFLILIMTPAAMRSEIARKEWRYARQRGVCVYPVKGVPDDQLDYQSFPGWMSKAHFFDLEREWETFVNYLKSPCQAVRVPFMAPDLPPAVVKRPALLQTLLNELIGSQRNNSVAITTALRGAGGLGKTTVACLVCHDDDVTTAFDDGILWATIGQKPNVQEHITKLYAALTGNRPAFVDEEDAAFNLAQVLEDKRCLIVLDDIWDIAHLKPFLRGGSGCSRLITTRNFEIASDSKRIDVDEMTPSEAIEMLSARIPQPISHIAPFRELAHRLGEWPLLLELANASLRLRIERGDTIAGAVKYLHQKLDAQGVVAFDQRNPVERNQALTRTIELSLEQLSPDERERYYALAIFPEDLEVPLEVLSDLWNSPPFAVEELIQHLDALSLLKFNLKAGKILLHDVLRVYLTSRSAALASVHARLVAAWKDPLRLTSKYAWRWLPYHMSAAGQTVALRSLLLNFAWLQAKLNSTHPSALVSDFRLIEGDPDLDLLQSAIQLSAHVISFDKTQFASQLLGRLQPDSSSALGQVLLAAAQWRDHSWVRPLKPSLTPPGGSLLFTLKFHTGNVRAVAITPDGRLAISGSDDRTVRVWNLERGTEESIFEGHEDWVRAVAVSPDGRFAISASDDHTVRVWNLDTRSHEKTIVVPPDWPRSLVATAGNVYVLLAATARDLKVVNLQTGVLDFTLRGHTAGLNSIAVTNDGRFAVTASDDRTIKVWNLQTRSETAISHKHRSKVNCVALTADGTEVVSAGRDTLRLWNLSTGADAVICNEAAGVRSLAITDSRRAIAACDDGAIKIWNLDNGEMLGILEGHTDAVNCVALTPDGRFAVSASADRTLKVWNVQALRLKTQQRERIRALSVSADGRLAVSTSDDGKLRVWNVEQQTELRRFRGHAHWPVALTPDGSKIVTAASDATVQVLDAQTGTELRRFSGHTDRVKAVAVTPDGVRAISASDDRTIKVWNLESGAPEITLNTERHWVRALTVTPDGRRLLSASDDRTVKVWDLSDGTEVRTLWRHDGRVNAVAVMRGGQRVISAADDHSIKIWDVVHYSDPLTLHGHTGRVNSVAVLPGEEHIVSVSDDATVRIWDCKTGNAVAMFSADSPLLTCAVAINGIILAGDQTGIHHFLSFNR